MQDNFIDEDTEKALAQPKAQNSTPTDKPNTPQGDNESWNTTRKKSHLNKFLQHFKDSWAGRKSLTSVFLYYFLFGNFFALLSAVLISRSYWKIVLYTQFWETGFWVHNSARTMLALFFLGTLKMLWSCTKNVTARSIISFIAILIGVLVLKSDSGDSGFLATTVTFTGPISPSTFIELQKIVKKSWVTPSRLIVTSEGGEMASAMAIGLLVRKLNMDVEVRGLCASACANFIFPSGKVKFLGEDAMVIYHGNMRQKNIGQQIAALQPKDATESTISTQSPISLKDKEVVQGASPEPKVATESTISTQSPIDVKGKEAVVSEWRAADESRVTVMRYIGMWPSQTYEEYFSKLSQLESKFYEDLQVDPNIGIYGQEGAYLDTYQSYKYWGFYYSLESLQKMGVTNVVLTNGQWNPEKNSERPNVYEVKL